MDGDRRILKVRRRLAAVSPLPERSGSYALPAEVDWLCIRWGAWVRTRKFYGAPHARLQSAIGRLRVKTTAPRTGPGIAAGAELAQFHQAVAALDDAQRMALEAYYVYQLRPIKAVADALGVHRVTFYRLLHASATQAYARVQGVVSDQHQGSGTPVNGSR